jgi:hypothetical protein
MITTLKRALPVLILIMACAPVVRSVASSPPARDPFLAQLAGRWDFVGTVRDKPVRYRAEGRWQLQDGWLCLSLVETRTPPDYEASVYIGADTRAGDYVAHWLDRFGAAGARVVATGKRDGQTLVLLFPYEEGAFRDTLTLASDGRSGTLLIESQEKDGHWSRFASYTLTRVKD